MIPFWTEMVEMFNALFLLSLAVMSHAILKKSCNVAICDIFTEKGKR